MGRSQDLYLKAKKLIPGGTQLLSKRPEMFLPDLWPAYYSKAKGCYVWDIDGNEYIDMSYMGIGSCILGYADPDVDGCVKEAIEKGNMSTLNSPEEVELAEVLTTIHPWADSVRYQRTGGEAMAVAVRIARAYSKKNYILFCGYHGWHDWYLAANISDDKSLDGHLLSGLSPKGVPRALIGHAMPFKFNDLDSFGDSLDKYGNKIGTVVLEIVRDTYPTQEFIDLINQAREKLGFVLIIDEITSGWRLNTGGAHLGFNIIPDIAVFAKGMSNGFPMAAVVGKSNVMDSAQETFISSTYWTDRVGPTAAIASIRKMRQYDVQDHLLKKGESIQEGWRNIAKKCGLDISVSGIFPLSHFAFQYKEPLVLKTLFTQYMLKKGFLASTAFYASYAHKDNHVDKYLKAVRETFEALSGLIERGNLVDYLDGPVCHSGFKRLT